MAKRQRAGDAARLKRVNARFDEWRRTRRQRRIPEQLWLEAAEVARDQGIHRTAVALRLNEQSLRERVRANAERGEPAFVELTSGPMLAATGCVVEVDNGAGARLRVELRGCEVPDLAALTRSFLEA
jgi:hypothetical protein